MKVSSAVVLVLGLGLFGRKHRPAYTPPALQGNIPVVVVNRSTRSVCGFTMVPKGAQIENWLGGTKLAPGQEARFSVRAGTYGTAIVECDQQHGGVVQKYVVSQPLYVEYGHGNAPPPPGYHRLAIAEGALPSAGGYAGGGESGGEEPASEPPAAETPSASQPSSSSSTPCLPSGRRASWSEDCCSKGLRNNAEGTGSVCK